jgi:REP element-mobilizing transposase RayT
MARDPRAYDSAHIYHLTAHGIDDRPIFRVDADFQDFALRLRRVGIREAWEWHAACLMDTHYHLVFRPTLGRVSSGMRDLNGAYARAFNKRHKRRGALFESRYTERTIRDEEHLASTIRYVEFNAVTAGKVSDVEDWPWTTHDGAALKRCLTPQVSDTRRR